jgi:hypothetical protein
MDLPTDGRACDSGLRALTDSWIGRPIMHSFRKVYAWVAAMAMASLLSGWSLFCLPYFQGDMQSGGRAVRQELAHRASLTDLCLFTDARYLRHLSQADWHSAFQETPMAFDYFPSGSWVPPPYYLWESFHEMAENPDSLH